MAPWLLLLVSLALTAPASAYTFASGSYTVGGTATDNRTIDISDSSVGAAADFQPELVIVKCNNASAAAVFSTKDLTDETVTFNQSGASFADAIQSMVSNGFVVGTSNTVQATSSTCYYVAMADDGVNDDFAVFLYTGDGNDNRDLVIADISTSDSFEPSIVVTRQRTTGAASAYWRTSHMGAGNAMSFTAVAVGVNWIQALNPDGFELGNATNISNTSGQTYVGFAIKTTSASGPITYTGTGSSQVVSIGYEPQYVFVAGDAALNKRQRFQAQSGDAAISFGVGTNVTGCITAADTTSITVGTVNECNQNTVTFYGYAIQAQAAVSARRRLVPLFFP
jgi:hypothetical protein